jgi:hypothetical protein
MIKEMQKMSKIICSGDIGQIAYATDELKANLWNLHIELLELALYAVKHKEQVNNAVKDWHISK